MASMSSPGMAAIPEATVARLPVYLRALRTLQDRGTATVSSEELAGVAGVNSAKLRKDLSFLGSYGTRGVGYDVEYLIYQISRELGLSLDWPVAIIGIGNLGHALANYGGFVSRGFRIAALFDADPRLSGNRVAGLVIRHIDELDEVIADLGISIGVIAVPPIAAQSVADRLVTAGSPRSSTSPRPWSPCPRGWTCARWTCPSSCRSSRSTSSASPRTATNPGARARSGERCGRIQ
jgi:redox-sensing transcriptional repressor